MKITLMSATKRREQIKAKLTEKQGSMRRVVEKFLNGQLKRDIEMAGCGSVNTKIPFEAYDNTKLFYALCKEELTKLGYDCDESHDGGGLYGTLFVSWKTLPIERD